MSEQLKEELTELSEKIEHLNNKIDGGKKRDGWDKLQILASFVSSILFAGVGLYFTSVYNDREAKRQEDLQNAQLSRADREEIRQVEMQKVQKEINQLEAIIRLTPLLTSKDNDTKRYALITLQALYENKNPLVSLEKSDTNKLKKDALKVKAHADKIKNVPAIEKNARTSDENSSSDLLRYFAQIALADNANFNERKEALKSVRDLAINPKVSKNVKEEATGIITKISISKDVPEDVRKVADKYLKDIIGIPRASFESVISKQKVVRNVDEIILHHTLMPAIKNYKDTLMIRSLAQFQIQNMNWSYAGWHYMISPDGLIWTGRPMDVNWTGITGYRNEAISVTLLLNGDEELPTDEQRTSLVIVINTLCKKFSIDPMYNFSDTRGFHRDHNSSGYARKTCPGKLITKEMVLNWLNTSDHRILYNSNVPLAKEKLTKANILSKLKKIIVEKLNVDSEEILMESNFTEDLGADDLDVVELIMEIEKEFNISISNEDAERMTTVKIIFDYLLKEFKVRNDN